MREGGREVGREVVREGGRDKVVRLHERRGEKRRKLAREQSENEIFYVRARALAHVEHVLVRGPSLSIYLYKRMRERSLEGGSSLS